MAGRSTGRGRFGLLKVDFAPRRRTPKASYAWHRDLIAARRVGE